MKKNLKKKFAILSVSVLLLLALAACTETDVVGETSITSFEAVLNAIPDNIQADDENGGWSLTSPTGSERFIWSKDFSSGTPHDVMLEFDAKPFLDAGLDPGKLPAGMFLGDKIMVGTNLGEDKLTYQGDATPLESYKKIVELKRDQIKYHKDLDHYGVDLGEGNMFEWAKDMGTNDKDIVFVLNPQMFIDAGVDPEKVEGWLFAKVKVMDEDGKPIEVDKFLKPFNLK
ncbi:hypothetical protein [Sinanaerobacter chloroacetimidivorans]|jgi:hypothetical protein|uniref:Lipoprotein n=1 Tax=Sinanaerobacter chloroacetimidivorans TaxID=2818044 RepID=A0A8J7W4D8_9FIRM|nr:hypothetical protein [Sinanaerobacter chloroacetimidivorans]MBR0598745.1 hypothetical protein [Sinanaerobacter chloroacetimidivorans]